METNSNNVAHCWTGKTEYMHDKYGYGSNEHVAALQEDHDSTCMLEHGHGGDHEFVPDNQIVATFQ